MNPRSLTFNRRSCDGAVRVPSSSNSSSSSYYRSMQTFPPERHTDLVRSRGGLITVPRRIAPAPETGGGSQSPRLTKLLLNVTIERSLGPIHVVISPENKVRDLTKTALEIYAREKRRPLLPETDPNCFELHYSQFSLESEFFNFSLYSLYHVLVCNKNVVSSFWIQLYNTYNISFNLHHPRSSTIIIAINFYFETRSGQWAIFWRIISNLHETPSVVFGFTTVTVLCVGFLLSIKHMAFCKLMVCLNITYFTETENIVIK